MDIYSLLNNSYTGDMLARIRRHRRPWTAKDYLIFGIGLAVYLAAHHFIPKLFPSMETKLADKISLGMAAVVMIVMLFAVL